MTNQKENEILELANAEIKRCNRIQKRITGLQEGGMTVGEARAYHETEGALKFATMIRDYIVDAKNGQTTLGLGL